MNTKERLNDIEKDLKIIIHQLSLLGSQICFDCKKIRTSLNIDYENEVNIHTHQQTKPDSDDDSLIIEGSTPSVASPRGCDNKKINRSEKDKTVGDTYDNDSWRDEKEINKEVGYPA
jgi:hypothetical protein